MGVPFPAPKASYPPNPDGSVALRARLPYHMLLRYAFSGLTAVALGLTAPTFAQSLLTLETNAIGVYDLSGSAADPLYIRGASSPSSIAAYGDSLALVLYPGSDRLKVVSFSGRMDRELEVDGAAECQQIATTPSGRLFGLANDTILELDPTGGAAARLFAAPELGAFGSPYSIGSIVANDSALYYVANGTFDPDTAWRQPLAAPAARTFVAAGEDIPTLAVDAADEVAYVFSEDAGRDQELYSLDLATGARLADFDDVPNYLSGLDLDEENQILRAYVRGGVFRPTILAYPLTGGASLITYPGGDGVRLLIRGTLGDERAIAGLGSGGAFALAGYDLNAQGGFGAPDPLWTLGTKFPYQSQGLAYDPENEVVYSTVARGFDQALAIISLDDRSVTVEEGTNVAAAGLAYDRGSDRLLGLDRFDGVVGYSPEGERIGIVHRAEDLSAGTKLLYNPMAEAVYLPMDNCSGYTVVSLADGSTVDLPVALPEGCQDATASVLPVANRLIVADPFTETVVVIDLSTGLAETYSGDDTSDEEFEDVEVFVEDPSNGTVYGFTFSKAFTVDLVTRQLTPLAGLTIGSADFEEAKIIEAEVVSTREVGSRPALTVHGNPVFGDVLRGESPEARVVLLRAAASGQLIDVGVPGEDGGFEFELADVPAGAYVVTAVGQGGRTRSQTVVRQ